MTTQAVLEHHLHAFFEGLDPVMEDFTEASIVITPDTTCHGLDEIRQFYQSLIDNLPDGFAQAVNIDDKKIVGEVAFLVWQAKPWFPFCTDTFVVKNGKIQYQTFAAAMPNKA